MFERTLMCTKVTFLLGSADASLSSLYNTCVSGQCGRTLVGGEEG